MTGLSNPILGYPFFYLIVIKVITTIPPSLCMRKEKKKLRFDFMNFNTSKPKEK